VLTKGFGDPMHVACVAQMFQRNKQEKGQLLQIDSIELCHDSFWSHDVHPSVHPGEGSSSLALLKGSSPFLPVNGLFLFLGSCSRADVRSKVRDVVCVQTVKPYEANL